MSNVVQFLESLGASASRLTEESFVQTVVAANFEKDVRDVLLQRDPAALNRVLGGSATVLAYILPAEGEEPAEKEGEQPDDGDHEGPEHAPEQQARVA